MSSIVEIVDENIYKKFNWFRCLFWGENILLLYNVGERVTQGNKYINVCSIFECALENSHN